MDFNPFCPPPCGEGVAGIDRVPIEREPFHFTFPCMAAWWPEIRDGVWSQFDRIKPQDFSWSGLLLHP